MTDTERSPAHDSMITIRLSPQVKEVLEEIVKLGQLHSIQQAIARAIGDELFLMREQQNGWGVLLQRGREFREIIWPS
jgi:hypothetical protein